MRLCCFGYILATSVSVLWPATGSVDQRLARYSLARHFSAVKLLGAATAMRFHEVDVGSLSSLHPAPN